MLLIANCAKCDFIPTIIDVCNERTKYLDQYMVCQVVGTNINKGYFK